LATLEDMGAALGPAPQSLVLNTGPRASSKKQQGALQSKLLAYLKSIDVDAEKDAGLIRVDAAQIREFNAKRQQQQKQQRQQ
jgi:hypothetical protein